VPGFTSSVTERSMSMPSASRSASEGGRSHRHRDPALQVQSFTREDRVRGDVDLDVQVAGLPAAGADLALAAELDPGPRVDARRDLDGDRAARAHPAVARAVAARVRDDLAVPTTRRTRAQGPYLAEEGALHVLDLSTAVAGLAGHRARPLGRT
jgi:hypothetical protein